MRKDWLLVYALILGIIVCCFAIVNGIERRQQAPSPSPLIQLTTPSPRTTLIDPVTTTPFPTRTP